MSTKDVYDHDWLQEADSIIRDIEPHVHSISISSVPSTKNKIFFNMTTLEKKDFCVELSQEGFRIVGEKYDSEEKKGKYSFYETPYSMLDSLSPAYRDSFKEELFMKLNNLKEEREGGQTNVSDTDDDAETEKKEERCRAAFERMKGMSVPPDNI